MSRDLQQLRDRDQDASMGADVDVDAEHNPAVSRQASNAGLRREVQKKGPDGMADDQVHAAAERGTSAGGGALPHADKIQASFGEHDVSGIQAHVDPGSTRAMGAQAYATGNHVVFNQQPDLHTAAHEAAHVVQQQKGVHLKGGVGAEGDAYERQADAVADRVVAGKPAGDLLGPATGGNASAGAAVQRKPDKVKAHESSDRKSYDSVQAALVHLAKELHGWIPKLDDAMAMNTSTEAGSGPALDTIMNIYNAALTDSDRVGMLLSTADKSERKTLAPEVKQAMGGLVRFFPHMQKASNWMASHQGSTVDVTAIQKNIDGYAAKIDLGDQKLEADTTAPTGDEKALSKAMIKGQVEGLESAIESTKAGNESDAMRITIHARYLDNISKEHPSEIKAQKSKLSKALAHLDALRKDNAGLKDTLAEAHNHLVNLTQ